MKTCQRFTRLRAEFEREIAYLSAHSQRHADTPAARTSAKQALSLKQRMSRALVGHAERCLECG
jgi:predicted HicB family RNase H-like nuclease